MSLFILRGVEAWKLYESTQYIYFMAIGSVSSTLISGLYIALYMYSAEHVEKSDLKSYIGFAVYDLCFKQFKTLIIGY